jgi:hypothetical protein
VEEGVVLRLGHLGWLDHPDFLYLIPISDFYLIVLDFPILLFLDLP